MRTSSCACPTELRFKAYVSPIRLMAKTVSPLEGHWPGSIPSQNRGWGSPSPNNLRATPLPPDPRSLTLGVPVAYVRVMFSAPCFTFSSTCSCLWRASRCRALGCSTGGGGPGATGSVHSAESLSPDPGPDPDPEPPALGPHSLHPSPPLLARATPEEALRGVRAEVKELGGRSTFRPRGSDFPLTSQAGPGVRQHDARVQRPQLSVQLLQAAVGGTQELLHVAQVAAVRGYPPQLLYTLLDFQLLLDGPADHLFLILRGPLVGSRLWNGRAVTPPPIPATSGRGSPPNRGVPGAIRQPGWNPPPPISGGISDLPDSVPGPEANPEAVSPTCAPRPLLREEGKGKIRPAYSQLLNDTGLNHMGPLTSKLFSIHTAQSCKCIFSS